MKKFISVLFCCLIVLSVLPLVHAEVQPIQIYVSPDGNDGGNGSKEKPFRTIESAQERVRALAGDMQSDIVVNLMGGTYYLDEPIMMDESDSGKNGHKIIWQSIPGENAVISGGVEISGWEQWDGDIWKIKVPEKFIGRYISNVYIGERVATFSRIEDQYFVGKIGDETNENGEAIKTATFSQEEIPYDAGMTDVFLFWDYNWRHYLWPVNDVTQDKNDDTVLKMISGVPTLSINTMYTPPNWNFILANAYAFLDRPGEFYYDRKNGEIYYYKDENEDLNSQKTIIPYLEYLWRMEGETTANPVENISFDRITFSHSMSQRNYQYGMYPNQGLEGMYPVDEGMEGVSSGMTNRGAVEVLNARNISFENNTFSKLDNIGLAMYSGVYDSVVCGNIFKDLSDTALCIGEPSADQNEKEKLYGMTDISVRKPITYSESYTVWYQTALLRKESENFAIVDLEEKHSVSKVYLKLETDIKSSDVIEIQGSNTKSFAAYEVLSKIYGKNSEWQLASNEFAVDIGDPTKYRYIRIINKMGAMDITEFRVYTDEFAGGARGALCENIDVTDNLMVRTVREFWSSVVIQSFTAKYINISYNEIAGCPYSGISLGWNWEGGPDMPGIKINYNRIKDTMQRNHDGAAIYVLGSHTDSEIRGNYITGCINGMGGIYSDNGSCYWTIEENVIEEVNISLHPWSADQHDITMKNNYTTAPYYVIGAVRTTMEDTELFIRKNMPAHIRKKANLAGIREPYTSLAEKVGEGETPYDPILIDGYPAPQCYAPHYFWNEAFSYLHAEIMEAENMLNTAKLSGLIAGYEEKYAAFETATTEAKILLNGEFERNSYYTMVRELKRKIDEFAVCGIFTDKEYVRIYQNFGVPGKDTAGQTVVSSKKPIYLDLFVDDYSFLKIGAGTSTYLNSEKTQYKMTNSDGNVTYLASNKFKDSIFEGKIRFEPVGGADWQGIILRATDVSGTPGQENFSCYIIDFVDYGIEVQRFNDGKRTVFFGNNVGGIPAIHESILDYGSWQRTNLSDIKVGTVNEENGVRIFLTVNGVEIFNILDDSPDALLEGGYFGMVTPDGTITIEKKATGVSEYRDLSQYDWARTAIYQLSYAGIVNGTAENVFSPAENITRAEFVKILAGIFNLNGTVSSFADISSDDWYFASVAGLESVGAFDGIYSGSFEPDTPIIREEMVALSCRVLKAMGESSAEITASFTDADEISENLRNTVLEYASMGLISGMGDGRFAPKEMSTRAQAVVLLYNLYSTWEG